MASTDGQSVKERVREERLQRRRDARIEQVRKRASQDRVITEFQPDAVEIEHRKVAGGARWTLYAVAAFISIFILWSYWAQVDQIVVAQGRLITTENAIVVQSISTETIHSIHAKFGERVKAGDLVATLDPTFTDVDLGHWRDEENAHLAKIARLTAELEGKDFSIAGHEGDREWEIQATLYNARKREVNAEMRKFDAEIAKLASSINAATESVPTKQQTVKATKGLFEKEEDLFKKASSSERQYWSARISYMKAKDDFMATKKSVNDFQADKSIKETEKDSMIASRRSEVASELEKATQELKSVEDEITKAKRMDELHELRVPTDSGHDEFVVFEVAELSVGSILQEGQPLFKLIPIDVPLEAEVEISGRDVAKIRSVNRKSKNTDMPEGSLVTLKLGAFDYQDHGTLKGFVRTISEGVFDNNKQQQPNSAPSNFKARIKIIEPATLENVPADFRLMPGMSTTAEIKVGRRRVIQYFLYPILRYMDDAFREP